jgi:hypothetical protein
MQTELLACHFPPCGSEFYCDEKLRNETYSPVILAGRQQSTACVLTLQRETATDAYTNPAIALTSSFTASTLF